MGIILILYHPNILKCTQKVVIPEVYSFNKAYPNPFNPTTTLNFAIPVDNEVCQNTIYKEEK